MDSYFDWLQSLPFSVWISASDSVLGFPLVLFVHSLGMGFSAGSAFVVALRLLGVGRSLQVSALRLLATLFWGGFILNLVSGSILFAARATLTGHIPIYYAKLGLILVGMLLFVPIRSFVNSAPRDAAIPARIQAFAALSLVVWVSVITTGRFIAYLS
jgi:hypothetical protein